MKKILSLAILLSGISFASIAQEKTNDHIDKKSYVRKEMVRKDKVKLTPEQIAEKRTAKLDKELKFTEDQRKQVYQMNLDQAVEFKKKQEARAKERMEARKARKAQREAFQSILSAEQKELWNNKLAAHAKRHHRKADHVKTEGKILKFRRGGVQFKADSEK